MNIQRILNIAMCVMVILVSLLYMANFAVQAAAYVAEQEALSHCMLFGFPEATIVDGVIYCRTIYEGTALVVPLVELVLPGADTNHY